ncbi:alpha-L-rhamnosidase C-terminal domain-containing protein [Microbacterium sp. A93]|uniref:alpha-L-rhamnosidase C-terminal domain-containing protein n=1 Tax=unclassified Microbacterium TaxID=2609290 RepID=UPI003F4244F5
MDRGRSIEAAWQRTADGTEYTLSVPTGVEGVVLLPGAEDQRIESGGRFTAVVA